MNKHINHDTRGLNSKSLIITNDKLSTGQNSNKGKATDMQKDGTSEKSESTNNP